MPNGHSPPAPPAFHFAAGLTTGLFTAAILQPIDLLKTRVQQSQANTLGGTLKDILRGPNAVKQLWRGTLPSIIRTSVGSGLYFSSMQVLRQNLAKTSFVLTATDSGSSSSALPKLSNTGNVIAGAVARGSAGFVLMPVTVIKVRYESSMYSYRSMGDAARGIWRGEGIRGFFAGFGATAVRDAPYAGLFMLFYEQAKQRLGRTLYRAESSGALGMSTSTSASINFLSGVFAAGCATAITNPFDAVKTRIQLLPGRYGNMVQAASLMLREEGVKSMFQGLGLRMGRKALTSALSWTLYEEAVRRVRSVLFEEEAIQRI